MRPPTPSSRSWLVTATRRLFTSLLLLLIFFTLYFPSNIEAAVTNLPIASDEVYNETEEETARVVRISFLRGKSWIQRAGAVEWEQATLNLPLVEGDRLATDRDARLELQLDRDNFIRLDHDATLAIVTLRTEGIALSLSEGTLSLRLARFAPEREYFEIDAPNTTVACERAGLYRLDATSTGGVRLTVRNDGRARLYSERDAFAVRNNRTAERLGTGADAGEWDSYAALPADIWDDWTQERDRYIARRIRERDKQPYDHDVWGAEELDAYGDWSYTKDYGWVWRPRATAINDYRDWAPYRYGHWRWCPPYGWTWVGDEPWGWAPYHHGRWVYANDSWCWTPRFYGYRPHIRNHWRPALVVFVLLNRRSYSNHIAWYPLDYHQSYTPHYPNHGGGRNNNVRDSLTPLRREEIARLERVNPARLRAITALPAREFGSATTRGRAARTDEARDVLASQPVRGSLPVIPAGASIEGLRIRPSGATARGERQSARGRRDAEIERGVDTLERDVIVAARPPAAPPTRSIESRATGAATRERGVRLDDELRRTRTRENRDLIRARGTELRDSSITPGATSGATRGNATSGAPPRRDGERDTETGIFTRPASPSRKPRERVDRGAPDTSVEPGSGDERRARGRNRAPIESDENRNGVTQGDIFTRPNADNGSERAERPGIRNRERETVRPPRVDGAPDSGERPSMREERRTRPPRDEEAPARSEQPRPSEMPRERIEPRVERPEPRSEPARERPESRPDPVPESKPEPRAEPKHDPPTERTERPERKEPPSAPSRIRSKDDLP